ncbi:MAG TPA: hypothetical protein VIV57_02390 [Anaeromyxobacter sp.]
MSSLALPDPTRFRARAWLALGLSLWFLAMLAAGLAGAFSRGDPSRPPVPLGAVALLPILAFLVALAASSTVRRFVRALDLKILTFVQTGRVIGGVFVLLWAAGRLPAGFALPAGLGDLLVGVTAPLIASFVVPRLPARRRLYVAWAAFGILDLVVAATSGVLHSPTSAGILAGPITTAPMGTLPLSLIPTFLVPLALMMHVAALYVVFARPRGGEDAAR